MHWFAAQAMLFLGVGQMSSYVCISSQSDHAEPSRLVIEPPLEDEKMALTAINSAATGTAGQVSNAATNSSSNTTLDSLDFLNLLIVQLENQSPLDPEDSSEISSQMTDYSNLQEAETSNDYLEEISLTLNSSSSSQVFDVLGQTVSLAGNEFSIVSGEADNLNFYLDEDAPQVSVSIYEAGGDLVNTIAQGAVSSGVNQVVWDATNSRGENLPDGNYSFEVSAYDSNGNSQEATSFIEAEVSSVYYRDGLAVLDTEKGEVSYGDVLMVS